MLSYHVERLRVAASGRMSEVAAQYHPKRHIKAMQRRFEIPAKLHLSGNVSVRISLELQISNESPDAPRRQVIRKGAFPLSGFDAPYL